MTLINNPHSNLPMVNYTSTLTSAANEIYVTQTDLPDSIAFMIKNKTIIHFDLPIEAEKNESEKIAYFTVL